MPASGPAGSAAPLTDHSCVMPVTSTVNPAYAEMEGRVRREDGDLHHLIGRTKYASNIHVCTVDHRQ